ncbi:hypothetical protein [Robbsia andropogonis]|uniref:hypothetical protein n=1 Tax=Robbsia andropogonis TaxID=28092 RepID=UPI000464BCF4|nr:hypothetical protein [Robbsia andropogonis]
MDASTARYSDAFSAEPLVADGAWPTTGRCLDEDIASPPMFPFRKEHAATLPGLPFELIGSISEHLDARGAAFLGMSSQSTLAAMQISLARFVQVASVADRIYLASGERRLSGFIEALKTIALFPFDARPVALLLLVQRLAHRQGDFEKELGVAPAQSEIVSLWRMPVCEHKDGSPALMACKQWRAAADVIRQHHAVSSSSSPLLRNTALQQLCKAETYLPWLSLVRYPLCHLDHVLKVTVGLPLSYWPDILSLVQPLLGMPVFAKLNRAFHWFSIRYREVSEPVPRELLVNVLRYLVSIDQRDTVRDALVTRFSISATRDSAGIVSAVAKTIAMTLLNKGKNPFGTPVDRRSRLSDILVEQLTRWDIDDDGMLNEVNRFLVDGVARQSHALGDCWENFSPKVQKHYRDKVLGAPDDVVQAWGHARQTTLPFWSIYLDITCTPEFDDLTVLWERINVAPWQLQGTLVLRLWTEYRRRSLHFSEDFAFEMSSQCVAWEGRQSTNALNARTPALALRAILASVQWQVTCARQMRDDWTRHENWDQETCRPRCPIISDPGAGVIEQVSAVDSVELIGALVAMRESMVTAGFSWRYDSYIQSSLRDLLCDCNTTLLRPSWKVACAISEAVADVWWDIPDAADEHLSRFDRFARRFDLPPDARDRAWQRVVMHAVICIGRGDFTIDMAITHGGFSTEAERKTLAFHRSRMGT